MMIYVRWATRKFFTHSKIMVKLGTMTLGVYCIQVLLAEGLFKSITVQVAHINPFYSITCRNMFYDYLITPVAAAVVIAICWLTIKILKKNKVTRLIFLGES